MSSQTNIRNAIFDQRSTRPPEVGVLQWHRQTQPRTWRLYDQLGPVTGSSHMYYQNTMVHTDTQKYTLIHISKIGTYWYTLVHIGAHQYTSVNIGTHCFTYVNIGRLWYRFVKIVHGHTSEYWYTWINLLTHCRNWYTLVELVTLITLESFAVQSFRLILYTVLPDLGKIKCHCYVKMKRWV